MMGDSTLAVYMVNDLQDSMVLKDELIMQEIESELGIIKEKLSQKGNIRLL